MALARSLPKPDARYDAFRAKLSLMDILKSRGYNLGADAQMLNPETSIRDGYERFQRLLDQLSRREMDKKPDAIDEIRVDLPADATYTHPKGFMSPLTVIFLASTSVTPTLSGEMLRLRSNAKRNSQPSHFLFVVDKPREITSGDAKLLGNNTLEILSYQRLLFNPLNHSRSPIAIEKLTSEGAATLLAAPGVEGRRLPNMIQTDPVALFLDVKPRDVCRITDVRVYTGQNMTSVNYRQTPRTVQCTSEGCENPSYTFRSHYCYDCSVSVVATPPPTVRGTPPPTRGSTRRG